MEENDDWFTKITDVIDNFDFSGAQEKFSDFVEKVSGKIGELGADAKTSVEELWSKIQKSDWFKTIKSSIDPEMYKKFDEAINQNGGYKSFVRFAWNLEEKETDELTLEFVMKWVKSNFNPKIHSSACLYVKKQAFGVTQNHLCYLDKQNEPMLDGKEKHLIIYAKKMDKELKEQLGNKDMLIFK